MQLGSVTVREFSDDTYWEDGGGLFGLVPRTLWQEIMAPDDRNRLPFRLRCLLIETDSHRILVDTGYGDKLSDKQRSLIGLHGERRLLGSLGAAGIAAEQINVVVNTHLHGDHCGGNTAYDVDGRVVPTFPQATYCVQRLEMADAMYPNERTRVAYRRENLEPLDNAGRLRILSGDTRLTDQVRVVVTPGHTRSHQSVIVESEGLTAIYLGDLAPWPVHMERLAWVPAFDVEPLVTIETRRNLARWAIENQALLIFDHHPSVAAGYLRPTERPDRFRLEPVEI